MTYVSTWSGWVYVAFVIDAYARRILGWRAGTSMSTQLVLDALEQAVWTRQRAGSSLDSVVAHTDRGSQYTSIRYTDRLTEAGIAASVGSVGDSYDNALAETINGLYKTELIKPRGPWRTVDEVEIATAEWVDWELRRNREAGGGYRASSAHAMAYHRASRPKPAKLVVNLALREKVEQDLEKKYSPEQITGRLRVEFPDDPEMWVSPETIYQSIYVQSRGALRRDLAVCLRTGRALRRPSRKVGQRKNRIPNMINIAERPPEVEDRAVPGNWEGDLIIGKQNQTAIGTLVERQTGYAMLLHLPDGYKPEQVRDALAAKIQTLPDSLRLSLTWDQGPEMRDWKHVSIDTPDDTQADQVLAGMALQRLWLEATALDLAVTFADQATQWSESRDAAAAALGAPGYLQVVVRVGHPLVDVPPTPRRALNELWSSG